MARTIELEVQVDGIGKVNAELSKLEQSLQQMKEQLKGVDQASPEFVKLSQSISQTEAQMKALTGSANAASTSIDNVGQSAGEAAQDQMTLNAQIGEAEDKLMLMAQAGDTSSAAYRTLLADVGRMKKVQMDTNIQIDRAAAGFTGKLTVGIQRVAAAYQVGMAATQMFGVESEKAQKIMAQLQAVMAFTQGVEQLKQLTVGMKLFGQGGIAAMSGLKKAIISTGIGALVVAVGMLIAYWDDIVSLISGGVSEQEKLVETAKQNVKVAEDQMEQFSNQENSLRLQGKSEKEILKLRMEKINLVIAEQEAYIAAMEQKSKMEVAAAQRNQDIAKMVIRGVLEMSAVTIRAMAAPIDLLIASANEVSEFLGFGKLTSFSINKEITKMIEGATEYASKWFFDPAETKKKNDELINEEKKKLDKLKSDRDGLALQIKQIEMQEVQNSVDAAKEKADKLRALREQQLDIIKGINERERAANEALEDAKIAEMEDGVAKQIVILEEAYGDERAALIEGAIGEEIKALDERYVSGKIKEEEYLKELEKIRLEGYKNLTDAEKQLLIQKEKEKNAAIKQITDEDLAKKAEAQKNYLEYRRSLETDENEKLKIAAQKSYEDEKAKLDKFLKDKTISQDEYNAYLIDAEKRKNDAIDKINTDAQNKEKMKLANYFSSMVAIIEGIKGEGTQLIGSILSSVSSGIASFVELSTKEFDKVADKVNAYAQVIGGLINSVLGAVSEEQKARLEENLSNVEETYNKEASLLEQQKTNGIISEQQYAQAKYQLDLQRFNQEEALKKKAFESEKKMKIASAIVSGLQGAVAAFAGAMTIPPPAGPIIGGIMAGVVAAMTAVNVAQIKNTKYEGGTPPTPPAPGGLGGEGGLGGGGEGAQSSPLANITTLFGAPMTSGNEGGQQQNAGLRQPMRAYVLETDITNTQNTISTYEQRAEIG